MKPKVNQVLLFTVMLSLVMSATLTQLPSSSTTDALSILYVSTLIDQSSSSLAGSLMGGTDLYIHGAGFDPSDQNTVTMVGDYPCLTALKGVTLDTITCRTTQPTGQALTNLPIRVFVTNKGAVECSTSSCAFSYKDASTPKLYSVYPRSGSPTEFVKYMGIHRVTSLSDGSTDPTLFQVSSVELKIGEKICTRIDLMEPPINANSLQPVTCNIANDAEGGYYNVTEWTTPGYAQKSTKMLYGSVSNQLSYEFIVQPLVKGVSAHSGGSQGRSISIQGSGFSTDINKISVTVAGLPCTVTSSSSTNIDCIVGPDTVGNSYGRLQTDTTNTQVKGYISGSGFRYTRYDITNLVTKTIAGLRAAIASSSSTITVKEDAIKSDLQTPDIYGELYGQVFKGYFKAPTAGDYIFKGLADDYLAVYMSTFKGSVEIDYTTPVIEATSYSQSSSSWNYYYKNTASLTSSPITMAAGQVRYMEVYHINGYGPGNMLVSVESPNTNTNVPNQVYEVQTIAITPDVQPEIIKFTQTGAAGGTTNYKLVRKNPDGTIAYNVNKTINWNASANDFVNMLNSFESYYNYQPAVVLNMYDSAGTLITTGTAATYEWVVTINKLRDARHIAQSFTITPSLTGTTPTVTQSKVQTHSPGLTGTYTLSLNNVLLSYFDSAGAIVSNIPITTPDWQLKYWMTQSWGCSETMEVQNISLNTFVDGPTFSVSFIGCSGNKAQIQGDVSQLVGGKSGTFPTISVNTVKEGSTNMFSEPVTAEFLFTEADKPQVIVKVGGVASKCSGDCSYEVVAAKTPILNTASLTGKTLTVNVTDPGVLNFGVADMKISVDGTPCNTNVGSSIEAVSCTLDSNSDNSPKLRAGSYTPVVEIVGIGFAKPVDSFTQVAVTLTATTVTGTSGLSGGVIALVSGNGFPFSLADTPFTVTVCNKPAIVKSVNNIEVGVQIPSCGTAASNIQINFKSQTATVAFNYDSTIVTPTIDSISPTSYSPVLKGTMTITGSGFGTDKTALTAYLVNSTGFRVYQMNVLTATDTSITTKIPGGEGAGTFKVVVHRTGYGDTTQSTTNAAQFKYEILVMSVSPTHGSPNGGTVLTITGVNFCPLKENNQIYIGDAINWNCNILTASSTEVTCITPPRNQQYTNPEQNVVVTGRALVDSTCGGTCTFTYDSSAPIITPPPSTNFTTGNNYTIAGSGLKNNNVNPKVKVGTVDAVVTAASDTSVTFTFPDVVQGTYDLNVYVDGVGYASPTVSANVPITVTSLSNSTGSIIGNIVYFQGSGLVNPLTDPYTSISIKKGTTTYVFDVVSYTPSKIGVRFFGGADNNVFTLNYTYKTNVFAINYTTLNASTPKVSLTGTLSQAYNPSGLTLTFNRTTLISSFPEKIYAYPLTTTNARFGDDIELPIGDISTTNTTFTANANGLGAGKFGFKIYTREFGFVSIGSYYEILAPTTYTVASVVAGYAGGKLLTVSATGLGSHSKLNVSGAPAKLVSSNPNTLVYEVPPFLTKLSQDEYSILQSPVVIKGTPISDTASSNSYIMDQKLATSYYSTVASCYVGMDFGDGKKVDIRRVRYYPYQGWKAAAQYIKGSKFTVSNDGTTWTTLFEVTNTVHTGWNIWRPSSTPTTFYRYIRFEHNTTSNCRLAEIEVTGYQYAAELTSLTSNSVVVDFSDGFHPVSWTGKVEFQDAATSTITKIEPMTASPKGGDTVTITGTNFGTDATVVSVLVDGVACVVTSVTATEIQCTVGARPTIPSANTFQVKINQNRVSLKCANFTYGMKWSDPDTWGGDIPPVAGDAVFVPKGMVLLVDQSTPKLQIIIVEGAIIFADDDEMTVEAGSIIINNGIFRAGTEDKPHENKLTFILYGGYYDKQMPGFGNKAIGCHCCKFDMYGKVRNKTWTELDATANAGAQSITLREPTDWQSGEVIVIASTSTNHYESERRVINTYDPTTGVLTFDDPLVYKHMGEVETYGTDSIPLRAEVGLLTRSIVVTGDPSSKDSKYGAHVMMHGPTEQGLVGHIAYTQLTYCGQPAIVGRYCMHFHMNGDVSDSYVIGNAVHDSFARVLTIHGVHYLTVQDNVGHIVHGHNIFLEDGIETHNVIEGNLMISSIQVWNMLQTDITTASYWITNPMNTVRNNRAAGGDFYGFWYEIKEHPDGPSATSDIFPQLLPIAQSHDNIAHSNVRFGLRIFKLFSVEKPNMSPRDNSLADPWSTNPSIQNIFYNYVLYSNGEAGLLAEQMGNTIFRNLTIADSGLAGMQFHKTNFTKEPVIVQDCIIIGQTATNGLPLANLSNAYGLITPRTDGFRVNGLKFINFPSVMTVYQSCSVCHNELVRVSTSKSQYFERIVYTNVSSKFIFWNGPRLHIFYDVDGTMSSNLFNGPTARPNSAIMPYFTHNEIAGVCVNATDMAKWDTSLICDNTVTVRGVTFTNAIPDGMFYTSNIKWYRLTSPDENISALSNPYSNQFMIKVMFDDKKKGWSAPFVLNKIYNTWWNYGMDWTHVAIAPNQEFATADPAVIFRFNFTETRELFEVGRMVGGVLQTPFIVPKTTLAELNAATCTVGDYYIDTANQYIYVCISGKQFTPTTYVDLNGIKCRLLCPDPTTNFTKENFIRKWSNATQWPGGVMPKAGDNVTVNGNWTIIMDVDPAPMNLLQIDGQVIVQDRDTSITANYIWILTGSLMAGNETNPFNSTLNITLTGQKNTTSLVIDPTVAGNKYMVVNGKLSLFGKAPQSVWTRMTAKAAAGATSMTVESAAGWAIGDELGISPSFRNESEYEKVKITAVSGNTVTFTPALKFTHYGDTNPITNTYGTLDMRTGVGHLTRNIKIQAGPDANGWGFRVLVYAYQDNDTMRIGGANLTAVQFINGGQYDTEYSALHFLDTPVNKQLSTISKCSFVESGGFSVNLVNSANVTIDNNVFYLARKYIAFATDVYDYKFTNNLMIGARERPSMAGATMGDLISCYIQHKEVDFSTDNNLVAHNLCQGSSLVGLIFPFTQCQYIGVSTDFGFFDNTAGSVKIGIMMNTAPGPCLGGDRMRAYATDIGFLASPPGPREIYYTGYMMADNGRSMGLRNGHASYNHDNCTATFKDSWISAIARPNCDYCYGPTATPCSNNHGLRMLTSTINGEKLPEKFGTGFDVVCNQQSLDSKAFLVNVTFDNFRKSYTGVISTCSNNVAFKPHNIAHDLTGSHHLTQCQCTNCQQNAWAFFSPPPDSQLGWFGGCGLIHCTGFNNYLIQDHDGTFFGTKGTLIANNSWVGKGEANCTFNDALNGYWCPGREDFAVLQYENIAADFNTRIMWPVYLFYWGGNWTSETNGYREWQWDGPEPLNKRLGRFVSVVRLGQTYNMTFSAQPPSDARFFLQKRIPQGNNSDWVAIWIYYPVANAITVMANNKISNDSILATSDEDVLNRKTICGANKYFYKNGTVAFIVTGGNDCQVRVSLNSNVQITARLVVSITTFFNNGGVATFVDRMCSFLNISTNRMKVVGVYEGSAIVDFNVLPQDSGSTNDTATPRDPVADQTELQSVLDRATSLGTGNTVDLGPLGAVGSMSGQMTIINTDGSIYNPSTANNDGQKTTIIVAVVVSVLSVSLVGITSFLVIKKLRARENIQPEESDERASDIELHVHKEKEIIKATTDMDFHERGLYENKSNINIKQ